MSTGLDDVRRNLVTRLGEERYKGRTEFELDPWDGGKRMARRKSMYAGASIEAADVVDSSATLISRRMRCDAMPGCLLVERAAATLPGKSKVKLERNQCHALTMVRRAQSQGSCRRNARQERGR